MESNKYIPWMVAAGFVASLAIVLPVFAQQMPATGMPNALGGYVGVHDGANGGMMRPGFFGTVTAISGTTLTLSSKPRFNASSTAASTVYTVDASNATVFKGGATSTIASVAVGDMVLVQGTINGTNIVATTIRDGVVVPGGMHPNFGGFGPGGGRPTSTPTTGAPTIQGNGEPVVGGSVTAINGNTITVTNASNVTYTIDISNAKIVKNGTTTSIADVASGDNVIVQGVVNGTSVAASSVIDQGSGSNGTHGVSAHGSSSASLSSHPNFGFLSSIGNFFKRIFGF